jgi:hypothetical protein
MGRLAALVVAVTGVGLLLAGCGGTNQSKPPSLTFGFGPAEVGTKVPIQPPAGVAKMVLRVRILPMEGAHGERTLPSSFAVRPDVPVTVVFTNYTKSVHTFTSPDLGLNQVILPAVGATPSTTTVTFTPGRYDVFEWFCVHCGAAMSGKIYAIIATA